MAFDIRADAGSETVTATPPDYNAIIIGAGISGMHQLYRLRELGMTVRVFAGGQRCRRYLVLEPLPRGAVRLRKLVLWIFLL